jgi:GTPase SAR1 family protein
MSISNLDLLLIGDSKTGKTTFAQSFIRKSPPIDNCHSVIFQQDTTTAYMHLTECLDHEKFNNLSGETFQQLDGAFIMVDATRPSTLDGAIQWEQYLSAKSKIPIIFLVNKMDLVAEIDSKLYASLCDKSRQNWYPISSKTGLGIDSAIGAMLKLFYESIDCADESSADETIVSAITI